MESRVRYRVEQHVVATRLVRPRGRAEPGTVFHFRRGSPTLDQRSRTGGRRSRRAATPGIPGVHRWRLSEAIAYDEDRALRRVFNNPVMADALSRYTEELRQLSPELERKIRARELEQVKGQLHEDLGGLQARSADLDAVRRAHPRYASRIVFVPGRHIVGPSFDNTNPRQELSDGFYVANVNENGVTRPCGIATWQRLTYSHGQSHVGFWDQPPELAEASLTRCTPRENAPSRSILVAALISRSCVTPHETHVHTRSRSVMW